MSFRSDVRINTTEEGFNNLNDYINAYLKKHNKGLGNNLLTSLDVNKHKPRSQRYFGWNNILWYSHLNYISIDALISGLDNLKDKDIPFRFIRIGEEVSDIEEIINDKYLLLDYIDAKVELSE